MAVKMTDIDRTDRRILAHASGRRPHHHGGPRRAHRPVADLDERAPEAPAAGGLHRGLRRACSIRTGSGLGLLVFVEVSLDKTTPDVFERFAAAVRRAPEVLECHMVAGGFDYLVKTRVADMAAYRRFLGEILLALPGREGNPHLCGHGGGQERRGAPGLTACLPNACRCPDGPLPRLRQLPISAANPLTRNPHSACMRQACGLAAGRHGACQGVRRGSLRRPMSAADRPSGRTR